MWQAVRRNVSRAWARTAEFFQPVTRRLKRFWGYFTESRIRLSYFGEALAVELHALNRRRAQIAQQMNWPYEAVRKLVPTEAQVDGRARPASPDLPAPAERPAMTVNPNRPDPDRVQPQPIPCTAVGVALSGGGIRSAAFCLGALQALDFYGVTRRTDYLSTVSGGGYIGTCLTAAMSHNGGEFPFGGDADIRDNDAVGHIRNYSNYLMPRARSGIRNILDASSIILRGLLANALIVLTFQFAAASLTWIAYPNWSDLGSGSFAARLVVAAPYWASAAFNKLWSSLMPDWLAGPLSRFGSWIGSNAGGLFSRLGSWIADKLPDRILSMFDAISRLAGLISSFAANPFFVTILLAVAVAILLIYWAVRRSISEVDANDVSSWLLAIARVGLGLTILSLLLDLQPLLIGVFVPLFEKYRSVNSAIISPAVLISGVVAVATFADKLSTFLQTTQISVLRSVRVKRVITQILMIVAGLVLPLFVVVIYWLLAGWLIAASPLAPQDIISARGFASGLLVALAAIMWAFKANAYSLHQFYKDRLGKAFLFRPQFTGPAGHEYPPELLRYKLSHINAVNSPYQIINAALNVQGSKKANQRGRNADFFSFTRDFVGSDLTHFAVTSSRTTINDMETVDPRLDLGAAMAISGAALSANMGSNTVRWLSPTLALLNIRLGYWLRNPLDLAKQKKFIRPLEWFYDFIGKFYLLLEMFNLLDENDRFIYLTDGGHIENLGIYQLLKRGCRLIIAIDAEADPEISCSSLLTLERYARIDLGIRIILPWEQIRTRNREVNRSIDPSTPDEPPRRHGQHCALGPILYEDGSRGMLLYFKSSLSGDEKDYLLDYKKRNPDFPHETTGDQFFTEEQFEVYRALGYHVVDGYFSNSDDVSCLSTGHGAWPNIDAAKNDVRQALGFPPPAAAAPQPPPIAGAAAAVPPPIVQ